MKFSTKDLTMTALCTAVLCVLAPISVPLPGGVPVSLATFAVALAGGLLGAKLGGLTVLLYLLIGALGVPVFAGYTAGPSHFVSPASGYLFGYIFLSVITGAIYFRTGRNRSGAAKYAALFLAELAGEVVLYVFGTIWFMHLMGLKGNAEMASLGGALGACVIPFIPGDLLKMIAVVVIVPAVEKALNAAGLRQVAA